MGVLSRIGDAFRSLVVGETGPPPESPLVDPQGRVPAVPMNWGFQYWTPGGGHNPPAPQSQLDYYRLAGDLSTNSIVAIALGWYRDNLPQGRICVGRQEGDEFTPDDSHPLHTFLSTRPNPFQSWRHVWGGTSDSYKVDGNAYWIKARDEHGLVQEVYWVPNDWIRVQVDSRGAVFRYIYTPGRTSIQAPQGVGIPYDPADVIHFRDGMDPRNPIMGISRLKRIIRNVAGYNAGETYTAAILRNSGMTPVALVPRDQLGAIPEGSPDEATMRAERRRVEQGSTGENAGRSIALSLPVDVIKLGESPETMMLDRILDRPEAVICAALGGDALVFGLPASDASRTYSNIAEADKKTWQNGVLPMQGTFADTVTDGLGPEFDLPPDYRCYWDNSKVEALNENADARATRAQVLFTSSLYPRNQALRSCGFEPVENEEDGELYYGDQASVSREATEEAMESQQEAMGPEEAEPEEEDEVQT